VSTFQALAAVFALLVLVRHGRAALALLAPRREAAGAGRLAGVVPLLACLAAAAVLAVAVKALLAASPAPGATP
jgi:hypothetical protein